MAAANVPDLTGCGKSGCYWASQIWRIIGVA
jgi:hypothetical protein